MGTALDATLQLSKAAVLSFFFFLRGGGSYDTLSWKYHRFNEVISTG